MLSPVSLLQMGKKKYWTTHLEVQRYCGHQNWLNWYNYISPIPFHCSFLGLAFSVWWLHQFQAPSLHMKSPEEEKALKPPLHVYGSYVHCAFFIIRKKLCSDWLWSATLIHSLASVIKFVFKKISVWRRAMIPNAWLLQHAREV